MRSIPFKSARTGLALALALSAFTAVPVAATAEAKGATAPAYASALAKASSTSGNAPDLKQVRTMQRSTSPAGGCHDSVQGRSYDGPCEKADPSTVGCESEGELASVPGNCPDSSEP